MTENCIAERIAKETNKCSITLPSIEDLLMLIQLQKQEYSDFSYQENGSIALVLKAKKNGIKDVTLKVVETKDNIAEIAAMKREYCILKQLSHSDSFVKINYQFFLTEFNFNEASEVQSTKEPNNLKAKKSYFVQEMDLYQGTLSDLLEQYKRDNNYPTESFKEALCIQMLDSVNFLHQRHYAHLNINTQNFIVSSCQNSQLILKLKNVGFTSPTNLRSDTYLLSTNQANQNLSVDPKQEKTNIEHDLFSLGLIFLQLDNIETFDYAKVSDYELSKLQKGKIFEDHPINRNSLIYQIACEFLSKQTKNSENTRQALLQLVKKSEENNKIPIFSVVLKSQIDNIHLSISQQLISSKELLIKEVNKKAKIYEETYANEKVDKQEKQLTTSLLKSALSIMLTWDEFSDVFDVIKIGCTTAIFGVENIKENRKSILKLSICSKKAETLRQISIMRLCQIPYIVQFYGYQFFEDPNHNLFVVYELERCQYSLAHHLELQKIKGEYSDQQKYLLTLQILDSINFLHQKKILHRNITLDNILITQNHLGEVIPKLNNFSNAAALQESFTTEVTLENQIFQEKYYSPFNCIIKSYNQESLLYFAPERTNCPYPSTYQTDRFSVGVCLILLDNYLVLSEDQLAENYSQFLTSTSFEDILKGKGININSQTLIYKIARQCLSYSPQQRKSFQDLLDKSNKCCTLYSTQSRFPFQENQQYVILTMKDTHGFEFLSSLSPQSPLLSNLNNLQTISLNFRKNQLGSIGTQGLLTPLAKLINISSLSLNLLHNLIGDSGAQSLLAPIANLVNLSSLTLNLRYNSIGASGAQSLLLPISNLLNLSNISLNLRYNSIGLVGAQSLLSPLSNLMNLSSLLLNLHGNSIGDIGAQFLMSHISHLVNLTTFSLNLESNQIQLLDDNSFLKPISNLINLSSFSLNLDRNCIGPIGTLTLLLPLQQLINLSSLELSLMHNSIRDAGAKSLLSPLVGLTKLSTLCLNLQNNSIQTTKASSLLSPLENLVNLSSFYLNLDDNQIGNIGGQSLVSSLISLVNKSNITLELRNNSITKTFKHLFQGFNRSKINIAS